MKQCIDENTPRDRDIMLWDKVAGRWEIGHWRAMAYMESPGHYIADWCEGYRADVDAAVVDGFPTPVFTCVTHWCELPGRVE